jgi:glycosyltransferase involved in cell wall biosynthesis
MKLIIQIPCLNEEQTLPGMLADLPRTIDGIDTIEWLVIDDGSTDRTAEVARAHGVDHVVRFSSNRGLAAAFCAGLQAGLELGADIIVNTDADHQYVGADVERLVRPILEGRADMVIGERPIWAHPEFGFIKKCLQKIGSRIVSHLARTRVPDVTSGFRAYSREAILRLNILTEYTYTHETIIQAGLKGLEIATVPIRVNPQTRPSRLFRSVLSYLGTSGTTILRIYTFYRALTVFLWLALPAFVGGLALGVRFLYYYLTGHGGGHIQSLILCAVLLNLSFILFVIGVLADLIGFNRRLLEEILLHAKKTGVSLETWRKTEDRGQGKAEPRDPAPGRQSRE